MFEDTVRIIRSGVGCLCTASMWVEDGFEDSSEARARDNCLRGGFFGSAPIGALADCFHLSSSSDNLSEASESGCRGALADSGARDNCLRGGFFLSACMGALAYFFQSPLSCSSGVALLKAT
eukprot:scaffold369440_cov98-Attheya_sp.AAC.2